MCLEVKSPLGSLIFEEKHEKEYKKKSLSFTVCKRRTSVCTSKETHFLPYKHQPFNAV